jgi:hypothetical protein
VDVEGKTSPKRPKGELKINVHPDITVTQEDSNWW